MEDYGVINGGAGLHVPDVVILAHIVDIFPGGGEGQDRTVFVLEQADFAR